MVLLPSCASTPERIDALAEEFGFTRSIIKQEQFSIVTYQNFSNKKSLEKLHVYLEGDGTPWLRKNIVAADPTSRNPVALKLMSQDSASSLYLGRPCYHGYQDEKYCQPNLWTQARYSQEIIDRMAKVLHKKVDSLGIKQLVFIGYSGGGVIAMLMAESYKQTSLVVTLAANLNIDAWTEYHGYSTLSGSLNPMARLDRYTALNQVHLAGIKDTNVPVAIIKNFVRKQKSSRVILQLYDKYDHVCCWVRDWKQIAAKIFSDQQIDE